MLVRSVFFFRATTTLPGSAVAPGRCARSRRWNFPLLNGRPFPPPSLASYRGRPPVDRYFPASFHVQPGVSEPVLLKVYRCCLIHSSSRVKELPDSFQFCPAVRLRPPKRPRHAGKSEAGPYLFFFFYFLASLLPACVTESRVAYHPSFSCSFISLLYCIQIITVSNNFFIQAKMSKIQFSGIAVSDIRGRVGGTIFSQNSYGPFISNHVPPSNPQTASQIANRAFFSTVTSFWSASLSAAQRTAWQTEAASGRWDFLNSLGQTVRPTGFLLFCLTNLRVKSDDFPILAPSSPGVLPSTSLDSGAASSGFPSAQVLLRFSGVAPPAGTSLLLKLTPSLSSGISRPRLSLFRNLLDWDSVDYSTTLDVTSLYNSLFGGVLSGSAIFCRMYAINDIIGNWQLSGSIQLAVV